MRALLQSGEYPSRNPEQNLADLKAQVAANEKGLRELHAMVAQYGLDVVRSYMRHVQDNAEESVRRVITRLKDGSFTLALDNGPLFGLNFNDITNAFKCYRREVIAGIQPLISPHFNLTVEMPLKALVRGYSYAVVPITWTSRAAGVSKLKLKEMGSRYLFIGLYLWLGKHLARGDYHRMVAVPAEEKVTKIDA